MKINFSFFLFFSFFTFNLIYGMNYQIDQLNNEYNIPRIPKEYSLIDTVLQQKQIRAQTQENFNQPINFNQQINNEPLHQNQQIQSAIQQGQGNKENPYSYNPLQYNIQNALSKIFIGHKPDKKPIINKSIKSLNIKDQEYIYNKFFNLFLIYDEKIASELSHELNILEYLKNLNDKILKNYKVNQTDPEDLTKKIIFFKKNINLEENFFKKINERIKWLHENKFIEFEKKKKENNYGELEENEYLVISQYLEKIKAKDYQTIDLFKKRLQKTLNIYNKYYIEKEYYRKFNYKLQDFNNEIQKTINTRLFTYGYVSPKIKYNLSQSKKNYEIYQSKNEHLSKNIHLELAKYELLDNYLNNHNINDYEYHFLDYFINNKEIIPDVINSVIHDYYTNTNKKISKNNPSSIDIFYESLEVLKNKIKIYLPQQRR